MFTKNKKADSNINEVRRVLSDKTDFSTSETYKTIRTNIMFSLPKKQHGKVIALTSSAPGEGKTTTCINLAVTFAQTGAKVIIVDCDLRRARIHRYLESDRGEGVSNILCGFSDVKDVIIRNARENLDVLTAGEIPLNPADLLETQEFTDLIDGLKKEYDYVFIDTPPVTAVTDATVIAKLCNGIIVIVRKNSTTFDMLDITMDTLKKTQTPILGAIILGNEAKNKKYAYNKYKYNYGYSYSDDHDED